MIGPWDYTAIGTNSPCDESPAYLTTLLDAANSAAAPASHDEASRYESAVVQDTMTSHMRDLPVRHGIGVNPSGRFPSERLRPDGSLETGTPAQARDLALTSLRWWCLTVLPSLAYIQDCASQKLVFHSGTGEEHKVSEPAGFQLRLSLLRRQASGQMK